MSEIEDVVKEFTEADNAIKAVFPKADPLLVVRLIFDAKAKKDNIYTQVILKPGQKLEEIRDTVLQITGTVPSFYLKGTKAVASHRLNLSLLKRINDLDYVISIKGSPYSAGGSSDF
jgi:hypothetical protein